MTSHIIEQVLSNYHVMLILELQLWDNQKYIQFKYYNFISYNLILYNLKQYHIIKNRGRFYSLGWTCINLFDF
jgi:hypothetical protein